MTAVGAAGSARWAGRLSHERSLQHVAEAAALMSWLWGRRSIESLAVTGDVTLPAALRARAALVTR